MDDLKADLEDLLRERAGEVWVRVVLDASGSMDNVRSDTIGGFNAFLAEQREVLGTAILRMVSFNENDRIMYDHVDVREVRDLTTRDYVPGGGTALFDAFGRMIEDTVHRYERAEKKPDKVIFLVITDGEENRSKRFTMTDVRQLVTEAQTKREWEFVFLGANINAFKAGTDLGVRAANSLSFNSNRDGTRAMYREVSTALRDHRTGAPALSDAGFLSAEAAEVVATTGSAKK